MNYCLKGGIVVDPANQRQGRLDVLIGGRVDQGRGPGARSGRGARSSPPRDCTSCPAWWTCTCTCASRGARTRRRSPPASRPRRPAVSPPWRPCPTPSRRSTSRPWWNICAGRPKQAGLARVCVIGCLTKGQRGEEMAELGEMARAGAVAFSNDGVPLGNAEVLRCAMEYSKIFGLPLLLHCEDANLTGDGVMHEGKWSTILGLKGSPALAEEVAVARDLLLAEATGRGGPHLPCLDRGHGRADPPGQAARRPGDRRGHPAPPDPHGRGGGRLRPQYQGQSAASFGRRIARPCGAALADGTIDVIASDHAPHTLEEKHREYALAPSGLIGLETVARSHPDGTGPAGSAHPGGTGAQDVRQPAPPPGAARGGDQPGQPADSPWSIWSVPGPSSRGAFRSKSRNTPFAGRSLIGKAVATFVGGQAGLSRMKICTNNV